MVKNNTRHGHFQFHKPSCKPSWRRAWRIEQARHILALRASQMSNQVLEWSGLLEK